MTSNGSKQLQREIHEDFIALVKSRRGGKLTGPEKDLFSGEYWTGRRAIESRPRRRDRRSALSTLRERFGDKVYMPLIAPSAAVRPPRSVSGPSA